MAATRRFSLFTMGAVLLLLLFHLTNLSVCIQVINYPYESRRAALEKIERPVIKHYEQPSITSVKSLVVHPEYEQITYDTVASSDMLCCLSANTEQNEEVVETHPVVQYSAEELLLLHRKNHLNVLANLFNRVLSNSILKIVHSILNTFDNHQYHPVPYFSHYNFGRHNSHGYHHHPTHSNKLYESPLLKGLTSKPHPQQQHQSQHHHQQQQQVPHPQHHVKSEHQPDKLIPQQTIHTESKNYKCMHV